MWAKSLMKVSTKSFNFAKSFQILKDAMILNCCELIGFDKSEAFSTNRF